MVPNCPFVRGSTVYQFFLGAIPQQPGYNYYRGPESEEGVIFRI